MPTADTTDSGFKVAAVVVTYNPNLEVLEKILGQLKRQTDSIIVVDNCSSEQDRIRQVCSTVHSCLFTSNLGLGKAHNIGIEYARSVHSSHVLMLDQDSIPDENMVAELLATAAELDRLGIKYSGVGCRYRLPDNTHQASEFVKIAWFRFSRNHCNGNNYVQADFLISSGSLLPVSAIDQIGMMDESLFIDHIDTEWFLRARKHGFSAYGCCNAYMHHGLGETTVNLWFGRTRQVACHKPFRYYYIFRNSFLLYKRRYMPFKWMLADWVRLLQSLVFFGLITPQRGANLKMMGLGIVHGVKGIAGRNDRLVLKDG